MNGVHDMGGMHGFGAIPIETDEPVFHSEWEARAFAITVAMAYWRRWNLDASRYARECIPPARYLSDSYYERWIDALIEQMLESGLITEEELETGEPRSGTPAGEPAMDAAVAKTLLHSGGPSLRELPDPPRFATGDPVRTANRHPLGHTRLPRYARARSGVIVAHHGAHVFPDTNALFAGEQPQHLYGVRFSARELWGADGSKHDSVTLDLWESYLEAL